MHIWFCQQSSFSKQCLDMLKGEKMPRITAHGPLSLWILENANHLGVDEWLNDDVVRALRINIAFSIATAGATQCSWHILKRLRSPHSYLLSQEAQGGEKLAQKAFESFIPCPFKVRQSFLPRDPVLWVGFLCLAVNILYFKSRYLKLEV